MERDDKALGERIYEIYPVKFPGKNLFAQLAASGNLDAVKYLFYNGDDDLESVGKALNGAAGGNYTNANVVEFLLGTGRIASGTLDKAFKNACLMQFLNENEKISDEALIAASFKENVPREFKCKAFVVAAKLGQMPVMKMVCESESSEWPLEVLKQALDAVGDSNDKIVKLVRKIVCGHELRQLHPPVHHTV